MDLVQLIILGLIQGITEFLPISSSAHLILLPELTGWQDQGLVIDIAAHVGSLAAVLVYFRADIRRIFNPWFYAHHSGAGTDDKRLLIYILIATLPVVLAAFFMYELISGYFRDPVIIALASILFGLLLWWSDRVGVKMRTLNQLRLGDAVLIGLAQAVALIPGTSRSGITMTAGLMLGMDRHAAARFSFLLAIPTIIFAGGHEGWRYFIQASDTDWFAFVTVAVVSAISAWLTIHWFLKFLEKTGMLPYVIYRVGLGIVLLFMFA